MLTRCQKDAIIRRQVQRSGDESQLLISTHCSDLIPPCSPCTTDIINRTSIQSVQPL